MSGWSDHSAAGSRKKGGGRLPNWFPLSQFQTFFYLKQDKHWEKSSIMPGFHGELDAIMEGACQLLKVCMCRTTAKHSTTLCYGERNQPNTIQQ